MEEALLGLLRPIAGTHWGMAPQGSARPYIVLTRISGGVDLTSDGCVVERPARVQADVYADTYLTGRALAKRLIAEVSGRRFGRVQGILVDGDRDTTGPSATGAGTEFRTSVDLMIHTAAE